MSVCVIGAGPAGLLAAAALTARHIPCEILDAGQTPGGIWDISRPDTPMYESAHFISSRRLSGFPGFPMPVCAWSPPRPARAAFDQVRAVDRPDVRGGVRYIASPRHDYYVKGDVYAKTLARLRATL